MFKNKTLLWSAALTVGLLGCKKPANKVTEGSDMAGSGSAPAMTGSGSGSATTATGSATGSGSAEGSGSAAGSGSATGGDKIVVKDSFQTPESVLYDADADLYLVSNINGAPSAADDNGFISRVSPEGKVVELKWIDGGKADVKLDAPKGLAITGGVLYVADISVVRMFDAKTGKAKGEVKVPGATFLNDVTPAEGGGVFVTDSGLDAKFAPTGTDAIYKIGADAKLTPVIKSKDLGNPNGIVQVGTSLWVVTFGTGELYEVNAKGEKQAGSKPPKGQLDGIVARDGGEFLVSSWEGKAVYSGKGAEWKTVLSDVTAPADLGWDSKRKKLLVPQFNDNVVLIVGM